MALHSKLVVPWHRLLEILLNCQEQAEILFRRNSQKYGPFKSSLLLGMQMYLVSDMKSRKSQYGRKIKLEYIQSLSNNRIIKKIV